jgi:hypothetical protein
MKITIDLPDYDPQKGVQHVWEPGFMIKTDLQYGELSIQANAAGLRSLANVLLFLAQEGVPSGSHVHLDDTNGLEDGAVPFTIGLNDDNARSRE